MFRADGPSEAALPRAAVPPPDMRAIEAAHRRLRPFLRRTPVLGRSSLDSDFGARILFKCEAFQKSGSFKARGAFNAVLQLPPDTPGVVTHSSGNHGAALALAARNRGFPAHVVMPTTAPDVKRAAVRAYGGLVTACEPTLAAREATAERIVRETGAVFIHPFDSTDVVAGQGTAALELIEDAGCRIDLLLVPVGGGGLLAGTLIAAAGMSPATRVIGVEPEAADDATRGFRSGQRQPQVLPVATIADGVTAAMSEMTFSVMSWLAADMVTVSEAAIVRAMRLVWERLKVVIEPSCALPLAAILEGKVKAEGLTVGIILTGGNVDLDRLPWTISPAS
ncbi:pyridoxal-phosphate dependent enzyme [Thermaurantiacus sp.]